jgi:hypothetical protein
VQIAQRIFLIVRVCTIAVAMNMADTQHTLTSKSSGCVELVADSDTPDFVVDHHLSLALTPGNS